ncbi:MAG: VWA domain-containing protein [Opitutae bacterium]|nr:VWA domain-containing protein [Opitutae bacterium]
MSFHSPHLLWLLAPLVLLFSWELARHTARAVANWPKIARAWAGAFEVSLGTKHTTAETRPRLWLWFGLALCLVALARPQWGVIEEQVFDQSREVLIAVDLSRSMLAQDVKPSRLDRSKLLITSLLDGLKGERVGLVLFAGTAFLQSPLSADYEVLREFLPALNPEYLPEGGSNYKAMLETSMSAFGTSTADRYLIILSDGESTEETWKSLTESLKTKGIRVIGLGVGTAQGSFIPEAGGGLVKDERGAVVMSRLNGSTLQELAQVTGGAYTDASAWVDLPALLRKTVEAGRKGEFSEKNTARLIERFQWFLAPGLLLLLISFWAEFPVRPRERALPLGKTRGKRAENGGQKAAAVAAALVLFSVLCLPAIALGATAGPPSSVSAAVPAAEDTLAKPLSTTVARLAAKDAVSAKELSELASTTVTYGQRVKSAQQQPPENVIRDGLSAVDAGEKLDAKAADWPKLRAELKELLKKEEPPKQDKKDQDKKDQQKQDKQQQENQQKQDQSDQQKSEQQQQEQEQKEQQDQQQQQQNKDAFGDMKEKPEQKKPEPKPQPQPGTQKVGGQQEKKPAEPVDAELAMPLQKLDQVRHQDSPAKLQQLMQGQPPKQKTPGKNW